MGGESRVEERMGLDGMGWESRGEERRGGEGRGEEGRGGERNGEDGRGAALFQSRRKTHVLFLPLVPTALPKTRRAVPRSGASGAIATEAGATEHRMRSSRPTHR